MKRYQRIISLLGTAVLSVGLIGCAGGTDKNKTETEGSSQTTAATAADTGKQTDGQTQGEPSSEAKQADPFGKYETPITISTVMFEENLRSVPEGMTIEKNPWIDLYREYGIEIKYDFVASNSSDMKTKVNLAIASGDLPDVFQVDAEQFRDLYEADMLADITEVYEQYASEDTKRLLGQVEPTLEQNVIKDGKRYGIVAPAAYNDMVAIAAVRKDWLTEAGLSEPETVSDVIEIAKTFKEKKMGGTCEIAIGMTKNVTDALTPTLELLNAWHAYAGIWMEKDGALVNSTIQPEMKSALEKMNALYTEGTIDPEFGSKDTAKLMEDAIAGRSGVVITHFCAPFDLMNGVKLGQEWGYYRLGSDDDEIVKAQQSNSFGGATVISKEAKNPEAIIKLYNLYTQKTAEDPDTYSANAVLNFAYPIRTDVSNANGQIHREYLEFLETGKKPDKVTQGYDNTVEAAEKYRLNKDMDGYTMWAVFGPEGTEKAVAYAEDNGGYMLSAYTGAPTESMMKYQENLKTMQDQMITYIINGTKPVSYFDEFVESWKTNGGDAITEEVNQWYQENK